MFVDRKREIESSRERFENASVTNEVHSIAENVNHRAVLAWVLRAGCREGGVGSVLKKLKTIDVGASSICFYAHAAAQEVTDIEIENANVMCTSIGMMMMMMEKMKKSMMYKRERHEREKKENGKYEENFSSFSHLTLFFFLLLHLLSSLCEKETCVLVHNVKYGFLRSLERVWLKWISFFPTSIYFFFFFIR